jgi:hypothetical protein
MISLKILIGIITSCNCFYPTTTDPTEASSKFYLDMESGFIQDFCVMHLEGFISHETETEYAVTYGYGQSHCIPSIWFDPVKCKSGQNFLTR